MTKKILFVTLLGLLMILTFASCSNNNADENDLNVFMLSPDDNMSHVFSSYRSRAT